MRLINTGVADGVESHITKIPYKPYTSSFVLLFWHIQLAHTPTKLKVDWHEQQRQQIPAAKRKNLLG